jgi:hypothetical protein
MFIVPGCQNNDNPVYGPGNPDPNPPGTPPAVLTAITPDSAFPGFEVVISGSGFNPVASENMVTMGENVLDVVAASATELTVITPPSSGMLDVRVAPRGAEEWSNLLQFNLMSYLTEIVNPEVKVIVDETVSWINGVDEDDAGNVYVGSQLDSAIYKIDPAGVQTVFASPVPVAGAIHFGPEGYLYVCQRRSPTKIVRISPDGGTIEDVVSVSSPVDFDWDADGNMYIVSNGGSLYMLPAGGGAATEVASGVGGKCCRVFEDYLYVSKVWGAALTRFPLTGSGLGAEEDYYTNNNPLGLEFDRKGVLYATDAWQTSIFLYAPGGAAEAIIYEGELETPMHYMSFNGQYIYVVFPGWGGPGVVLRVFAGVEQAPRYGRQ